ncbi:restriction endonuclease [Streptomyces sp. NPDC052773]|uniref:restriction endonuclease n=1 Tax=Streptomyces sp. NPDC052773 TaxID=3365693 RepID=UPI0037CD0304
MSGAVHEAGAPRPMQISSWQQAEHNAARWMRHWGYTDATARPGGPDAGIDIRARAALGQVKYQASQVGRPELQRFVGARPKGSTAQLIFFTGSDYTPTAVAYAQEWDIALFRYRLDGTMTPVNDTARRIHRRPASPTAPQAPGRTPAPNRSFWQRNWRVLVAVPLLMAPLGSIGDETTYTGPLPLDVLKFIGILTACWLVGAYLLATRDGRRVHVRSHGLRVRISRDSAPSDRTSTFSTLTAPPPQALVTEAARLLSTGQRQHQVDRMLRERGVGFLERGRILTEAKKLKGRH